MLSLQFHNVNKNFKRPQKSEKIPCPKFKKMGIRGLDTYINKRAPNVRRPTNILNVAEETLRSKVLIVDLNCVLRSSYKDLSLVNGGDFALFKNRWRIFLQKLEMAKIRPIFVIDGPTCVDKRWKVKIQIVASKIIFTVFFRTTWTKRRYDSWDQFVKPMFERLRSQDEVEHFAWIDSERRASSIPRLEIREMIM